MNSKIIIFLFLVFWWPTQSFAQKNVETQNLLWTRYNLQLTVNENYQINQEIEERSYISPWRQHQFVTRTMVKRKLGKGWNAGAGFTYFVQSLPHDPEIDDFQNRTELRPQLEIAYKQYLNEKLVLHHRYWSEFRIFEQENGNFVYGNNRSRYKIELRFSPLPDLMLKAFEEIHLNIGGKIVYNVFDQNRLGFSAQYMPWKNFGFELGYFNWYQQRASGNDYFNRHIVRFSILHQINLKNSTKN